jgi:hypothetical protein
MIASPCRLPTWNGGQVSTRCCACPLFLRSGPFHGPSRASDFATQFLW